MLLASYSTTYVATYIGSYVVGAMNIRLLLLLHNITVLCRLYIVFKLN